MFKVFVVKEILFMNLIVGGLVFVSNASAGPVTIPNTFQSGQPALASEVNGNFAAVKDAVDANSALIPVVKDGTGQVLGTFLDFTTSSFGPTYKVLNYNNYILAINMSIGALREETVFYLSSDCTGTPYFYQPQSLIYDSFSLYYVPIGATPLIAPTTNSYYDIFSSTCVIETPSIWGALFPLTPNDPAVTGVSTTSFTTPITIGRQ